MTSDDAAGDFVVNGQANDVRMVLPANGALVWANIGCSASRNGFVRRDRAGHVRPRGRDRRLENGRFRPRHLSGPARDDPRIGRATNKSPAQTANSHTRRTRSIRRPTIVRTATCGRRERHFPERCSVAIGRAPIVRSTTCHRTRHLTIACQDRTCLTCAAVSQRTTRNLRPVPNLQEAGTRRDGRRLLGPRYPTGPTGGLESAAFLRRRTV